MPSKRPSQRSTKAQILAAFDELLEQKKALEAQLKSTKSQKGEMPARSKRNNTERNNIEHNGAGRNELDRNGRTDSPQANALSNKLTHMSTQSIEGILDGLSQLQLGFGGAVSALSEKLVQEAIQLEKIQQTVTTEAEQLNLLHNLRLADTDLDDLFQQYQENAKAFDAELTERKETVQQEITQAQKDWLKAQAEHRRTVQERNQTQAKLKHRDTDEYEYTLMRDYKLSDETYEQEKARLYQEMEEYRLAQEKQWAEREERVAAQEAEFSELKAKIEAHPEDLKAAIKRAKEEGKGIANHQAKVKADLTAKDIEGQTRAYDLQIQNLQGTIQTQGDRLQTLSQQLDAALKQVQDLAVKAIEGASNASSFQAVKDIALEQAKAQTKGK